MLPINRDYLTSTTPVPDTPCEGPLWLNVLQSLDQYSTFYTLLTSIAPYGITGNVSACESLNGSDLGVEKECNVWMMLIMIMIMRLNYS